GRLGTKRDGDETSGSDRRNRRNRRRSRRSRRSRYALLFGTCSIEFAEECGDVQLALATRDREADRLLQGIGRTKQKLQRVVRGGTSRARAGRLRGRGRVGTV